MMDYIEILVNYQYLIRFRTKEHQYVPFPASNSQSSFRFKKSENKKSKFETSFLCFNKSKSKHLGEK